MKIFLTGASGFIGNAVAKKLSVNHQLIALSRSEISDNKIKQADAIPVRGELGQIEPQLLAGVDIIIHAAAKVEQFGTIEITKARQQLGYSPVISVQQGLTELTELTKNP